MDRNRTRATGGGLAWALVLCLTGSLPAGEDDVIISEILTANDSVLADEDGAFDDWIELHNAGDETVFLGGWHLTDDPEELTLWRFPPVDIAPKGYLIVFASGKDRADAGGELHTSFRLGSSGEFLGLVRPDGVSLASAFVPRYPLQYVDISYGVDQEGVVLQLVDRDSASSYLVPTSGASDPDWLQPGYDDGGWSSARAALGYDTTGVYASRIETDIEAALRARNPSVYVRFPFTIDRPADLDTLWLRVRHDDGFVAYLNGAEVARRNAPASPTWSSSATAEIGVPPEEWARQDFDGGGVAYELSAFGRNVLPEVRTGGPTGRYLELVRDDEGSISNVVGFDRAADPAEVTTITFDFRMSAEAGHTGCCGERADGFGVALIDTALYGESGPGPSADNVAWERPGFPGVFSVGFDIFDGSGTENTVSLYWNSVEFAAHRVSAFDLNAGVFHRCVVEVRAQGADSLVSVTIVPDSLSASPGDAYSVFTDQLVPGMEPFDHRLAFGGRTGSAYTEVHLDGIEVHYAPGLSGPPVAEIDLQEDIPLLRSGENVLAVRGLNVTADDEDFFLSVEMEGFDAGDLQRDRMRYFDVPTPGSANRGGYDGIAETPRATPAGGGFTGSVSVDLSVEAPETAIHYTLNRSEPTLDSPQYSSALLLSDTTVLKAKTFRPGHLPGPTATWTFFELASDVRSFDSDLPLVVVHTFGQGISQGAQTSTAAMAIPVDPVDGRTDISDLPGFQGSAGIKIRGSSSAGFPKKMYSFEIWDEFGDDLDVSLLGLPAESDWVLYAPYSDKSLMRNVLAYGWSNDIGRYAPRTLFVEMFLHTSITGPIRASDYVGVYVLTEKIKRSEERVDIQRLDPTDSLEPEITGGYILKKDRLDPGDSGFLTAGGQRLAYVDPKEREITPVQRDWIKGYLDDFEAALAGPDFADPLTGYAAWISVPAFIDHHILTEVCKNIDGYRLSTFLYKDRGKKVRMGPIWDYNLSLGNADYLQGWLAEGWYYPQVSTNDYPWYPLLFRDPDFVQRYTDRWFELRSDEFRTEEMLADVDARAAEIAESQQRNFERWPVLGTRVWPNWYIADTWAEEIGWMKGWIADRLDWMDSTFPPVPAFSDGAGLVDPGHEVWLSASSGTVWYTLDGSDPRVPGGAVSEAAIEYGGADSQTLLSADGPTDLAVLVPTNGALGTSWTSVGFSDAGWRLHSGGPGVGYERGSGYEQHIDVDVGPEMDGIHPSVYIRYGFRVDEPAAVSFLSLELLYDDGFVAYLNGQRVASANAPASPQWDSEASAQHDDGASVVFEEFDISEHVDHLRSGPNVLAIHGLNRGSDSSDLLIRPRLTGSGAFSGTAIVIDEPTHIFARTRRGSAWSAPAEGTWVFDTDLPLRVTELHYHPRSPGPDVLYDGQDLEFIEVANVGAVPVDLTGVRFSDGIAHDFSTSPVRVLRPGEHIVVVGNLDGFAWRYEDEGILVAGQYEGSLSNGGESIRLIDGTGGVVQEFTFDDAWYPETDGVGQSLVAVDPLGDPASWSSPVGWAPGSVLHGTPGVGESVGPPVGGLQRPGDANADGHLDLSDSIALLIHLFVGGRPLPCDGDSIGEGGNARLLDANGDGGVDISDAVHVLEYLFRSGSPPVDGTRCLRIEGCPDVCTF